MLPTIPLSPMLTKQRTAMHAADAPNAIEANRIERPVLHRSVLAWPASWRVAAVLPALLVLWLGVAWALVEVVPL